MSLTLTPEQEQEKTRLLHQIAIEFPDIDVGVAENMLHYYFRDPDAFDANAKQMELEPQPSIEPHQLETELLTMRIITEDSEEYQNVLSKKRDAETAAIPAVRSISGERSDSTPTKQQAEIVQEL